MTLKKAYGSVRDDVALELSANSDVPYRATLLEAVDQFDPDFYFKSDDQASTGPHPGVLWIYQRTAVSPFYAARVIATASLEDIAAATSQAVASAVAGAAAEKVLAQQARVGSETAATQSGTYRDQTATLRDQALVALNGSSKYGDPANPTVVPSGVADGATYLIASGTRSQAYKNVGGTGVIQVGVTYSFGSELDAVMANAVQHVIELNPSNINLFDASRVTAGVGIRKSNGATQALAGYSATPFIQVTPGSQIISNYSIEVNATFGIAFYNANKGFVSPADGVAGGTPISVPAGCYYMRFSVANAAIPRVYVANGGILPTTFRSFGSIDKLTLHSLVGPFLREFFASSINVFDYTRVTDNKIVRSDTGALEDFAGWFVTDFMPVEAGGQMTLGVANPAAGSSYGIAWYGVERNYLEGTPGPTAANSPYAVPPGAAYARVNYPASRKSTLVVVQGSVLPAGYKSFGVPDDGSISKTAQALIKGYRSKGNLFDYTNVSPGALRTVGTLDTGLSYVTSDFISADAGSQLIFSQNVSGNSNYSFLFYGLDKSTIIGNLPMPYVAGTPITVPAGAFFIRVTMGNSTGGSQYAMLLEATALPATFQAHPNADWGFRSKRWLGKQVGIIGDSITAANYYQSALVNYLGATLAVNDGLNGRQMGEALVNHSSTTIASLDALGIFLGTNDFYKTGSGAYRALGVFSDPAAAPTFAGDIRANIETLLTWKPLLRLFFMTPLHRLTSNTPNGGGWMLREYVDMILAICGDYGVPVRDLYRVSGMNALNAAANTIQNDGLHPTSTMSPVWIAQPTRQWLETI